MNISKIFQQYNTKQLTIGVLGSHSALEVCRGAKDEGFKTLVVAQKGREKIYRDYYKSIGKNGIVDETLVLDSFRDVLLEKIQKILRSKNVIFIPHRSFEVYLDFQYDKIEQNFAVPMFGNRRLLRIEERSFEFNQYDLLREADIRYPKIFKDPKDIDRLCLVKVLEKEREFERAFFIVDSFKDYQKKVKEKIKKGIFTEKQLKEGVIEEYIIGVHVNFNFFYSPIQKRLELLGTDTRRQTNIEAFGRIPSFYHEELYKKIAVQYEEAGHVAVTILESMLDQVYELGEKFVKTAEKMISPGVIGPFALQSIIVPGPPRKDIIVVDVSPRVPGSPGIGATPYSSYLFGESVSVGRRIAMEIKEGIKQNKLDRIIT